MCCYSAQDVFIIIVVPLFYPMLLCSFLLQSRTGFIAAICSFSFVGSSLFPVCFSVANCAGYKFCVFGLFLPLGCNFSQDNARFPPLPCCCNRPQVAIPSSFRLQFPAGNRCFFHRTRLSICAGSTLLLK